MTVNDYKIMKFIRDNEGCNADKIYNAVDGDINARLEHLNKKNLIEYSFKATEHDDAPHVAFSILYTDIKLSNGGVIELEDFEQEQRAKVWEQWLNNIKYIITTAIALAAFIKSFFFI